MKRSIPSIAVPTVALLLVGLLGLGAGYVLAMKARFPNTISHAFSEAPEADPGHIYPASGAVLWLLHDQDLLGHQETRYHLRVSSSTGDREYPIVTFSVGDVGGLMDARQARFQWDREQPALTFTLGEFQHRFDLGRPISIYRRG